MLKIIQKWSKNYRASHKPDVIIGADRNPPYMKRWWIIPRNRWFNIYLHEVGQDDDDRALHDHPWVNMSYVIEGGYNEHTIEYGGIHRRVPRLPGAIKFRLPSAAHRLELRGDKAVSLFITGPNIRKWGFHCPKGWRRYEDFVTMETLPDGTVVSNQGKGCGEGNTSVRNEETSRNQEKERDSARSRKFEVPTEDYVPEGT